MMPLQKHTFGDSLGRPAAMPLFELPALATQSICTNSCGGNKCILHVKKLKDLRQTDGKYWIII